MESPVIICGRGHSGTRLLAKIFHENGIDMGSDSLANEALDSPSWSFALFSKAFGRRARKLSQNYSDPWGWKLGESLFFYDKITTIFPKARFINLIRDGRDVTMSGVWPSFYSFQKEIHYNGIPISADDWPQRQWMLSWIKHVQLGLKLAELNPHNFMNIRYEDLCLNTSRACEEISNFIDYQLVPGIASTTRIAKWKLETRPEYLSAFKLAENSLKLIES